MVVSSSGPSVSLDGDKKRIEVVRRFPVEAEHDPKSRALLHCLATTSSPSVTLAHLAPVTT